MEADRKVSFYTAQISRRVFTGLLLGWGSAACIKPQKICTAIPTDSGESKLCNDQGVDHPETGSYTFPIMRGQLTSDPNKFIVQGISDNDVVAVGRKTIPPDRVEINLRIVHINNKGLSILTQLSKDQPAELRFLYSLKPTDEWTVNITDHNNLTLGVTAQVKWVNWRMTEFVWNNLSTKR